MILSSLCFLWPALATGEVVLASWWNMSDASSGNALTYDEQITAFAVQGLVNRRNGTLLFFDIGTMNYDWIHADAYWREYLEVQGRVKFDVLNSSLCSLLDASKDAIAGLVVYEGDTWYNPYGDGYSAAIALTMAAQKSWLPVPAIALSRHACLRDFEIKQDLRELLKGKKRTEVWKWAIETLLPKASKKTIFNLNHYRVLSDPLPFLFDKQSKATASSIDYIISQNAFVIDLESHDSKGAWSEDDDLIQTIFASLDPLFDAYGWSDDEFSWTNETSHSGGTIMCSFASPNLSFWAFLRLMNGQAQARKLPTNDAGTALNASKYYVTFETNEGDTPRILVSAMASSWASPERGSIPVAWAIDPLLAERFPALFDYYASTATKNDTFVAGTAGAGYAFLNQMSASQLQTYGERVGALTAKYGPHVFDTYGYANISVHEAYAKAAKAGGAGPSAFVTQPNWDQKDYHPYHCENENFALSDGTPLICTSGDPKLFYYSGSLDKACPSCDLAKRIQTVAARQRPPYFITVYGGLQAFGGSEKKTPFSFFTLLGDTIGKLPENIVAIGASDMARLSREALAIKSSPATVLSV